MTFKLSDDFNIKPPRAIECVTRKKDDGRCDIEVEGHVDHVETGEPIKVKSHTVVMYPPAAEDFRSLLVTFWDHEVREQLHMDPHGPIDPMAVNVLRERDEAIARAEQAEKRLASYRDIARERERADAWRDIASDAIDTLWAIINGNSSEWAKGKLESLRKRGQELMP